MQQHVLGLEAGTDTPPPPAQTGRDSRRFWQDLQLTAFLRGLAVHWLAGWNIETPGGWLRLRL